MTCKSCSTIDTLFLLVLILSNNQINTNSIYNNICILAHNNYIIMSQITVLKYIKVTWKLRSTNSSHFFDSTNQMVITQITK